MAPGRGAAVVVGGLVVVVVDVVVGVDDVVLELVVVGALVVDGTREVGVAFGDVGGATVGATGDEETTEVVVDSMLDVVVDSIVVVDSSGASVDCEPGSSSTG